MPRNDIIPRLIPLDVTYKGEFRSSLAEPDRWLVELASGSPTASGQSITERMAMQLTGVFCCVDLISSALAGAPLGVFEKLADDSRRVADDHYLTKLFRQPNDEMTAFTFRKVLWSHKLLWGNAYAEIERNGRGQPMALWPLWPDRTVPRRDAQGQIVYEYRGSSSQPQTLQSDDVWHLMGFSHDGLRGITPIGLHRETLGLTMGAQDFGARFFGNDARPGGIMSPVQPIRKEARDRIKKNWEEGHRGSQNAWRVAVMEQEWKWQSIGIPPEDAQFLETRVFQLSEIARIYHVPLHKLSELSHATFSNIEHQGIEYVTDALLPNAHGWEDESERKLLLPAQRDRFYVEHNLSGQMRGDMKSRFDAYHVALGDGFYRIDDVLKLENMNPAANGEGQHRFIPVTMQPIDRAIHPPVPEPAAAPVSGSNKQPSGGAPAPEKKSAAADSDAVIPKRPTARDLLLQSRTHLIRAFASSLEVVGERLNRKEKAALERAFGYRAESRTYEVGRFFDTYEGYVHEAFQPVVYRLHEALSALDETPWGDPNKETERYLAAAAKRYVESARAALISAEAIPTWCANNQHRCIEEVKRAAEAFSLEAK